jgi:hypothetical protein
MSKETHDGIMSTELSSLIHQSSLAILPAETSSSKKEEWAKGMKNLTLPSVSVHTCK